MTGKVKKWDSDRGFGFIKPDDGSRDCFVHRTNLHDQHAHDLAVGETVDFVRLESERGPKAIEVRPLGK